MSYNAHDLSNRLLNALDNNYNVVDMQAVNEIISILEKFNITKELLETTRLGKHVNELRRKTTDPTLARRAKVLVKRWRDLVIPTAASPGHTGKNGSNRSSAERQVRRLGGTPLTSPALSRMVSPAVNSPRPSSRPAWGGYESDSQDVILVDDDPPPPPPLAAPPPPLPPTALKPLTPPVKRPTSPVASHDDKKAKRDKKPKKRRGHSRAGSGTETTTAAPHAPPPADAAPAPAGAAGAAAGAGAWGARNGSERRRNGYRREKVDPYAALVNRMPAVGAKKVKTTKELLEEIQSRGSKPATSPSSPASPASPDVMLVEPDSHLIKVDSPLRNGGSPPRPASPKPPPSPYVPLEDEREYFECECGEEEDGNCPAKSKTEVRVEDVTALHHALLPGVNGTRAPLFPHKFAVRPAADPDRPGLFSSVVPLYKYSDYADDYCAKNMFAVPLCAHLQGQFAPPPPAPPRPPSPPEPRPYPIDPDPDPDAPTEPPPSPESPSPAPFKCPPAPIEPSEVGVPPLEPSERLKPPILSADDERAFPSEASEAGGASGALEVKKEFASELCDHRTVERTKAPPVEDARSPEPLNGRLLYSQCAHAIASIPYDYSQLCDAPALPGSGSASRSAAALGSALGSASACTARDALGRPLRPARFAEWHECARLGDLIALPYVVID